MQTGVFREGAKVLLSSGDTLRLRQAESDWSITISIAIDSSYEFPTLVDSSWAVIAREVSALDQLKRGQYKSPRYDDYGEPTVAVMMEYDSIQFCLKPTGKTRALTRPEDFGIAGHFRKSDYKSNWPNGQVQTHLVRPDSMSTEFRIWYDTNGREVARVVYEPDGPAGTVAEFWHNGQLRSLTSYSMGRMEGSHKYWHSDGSLGGESFFENGTGTMKYYYADGTPMLERTYLEGRLHGTNRQWSPDGSLRWVSFYVHNTPHGEDISYRRNGELSHKRRFDYGRTVYDSLLLCPCCE